MTKKSDHHPKYSWALLKEFLRTPGQIGAVSPSSRVLSSEIVRQARVKRARTIVEYGPGTGSFTREILKQMNEKAFYIGIESNHRLAERLKKQFPLAHIIAESAENTPAILKKYNLSHADSIVSGLPWASFPERLQENLIQATIKSLRPGGRFATFAYVHGLYVPAGRRFRKKLRDTFSEVHIGRVVWRNLPAAVIYRCTK